MVQKDRESFKEYAQRWSEASTQVIPPMEEKEMTKIFLKTLGAFYYERMVASSPNDFTEMVGVVHQNYPSHVSQNIARKISKLLKVAQELVRQAIS